MVDNHRKAFIRLFNETACYHHRYEVFRDFVMMSGISIHNAMVFSDEREQEYMDIVGRYKKDDAIRMSHLLAEVVMGFEVSSCDFLGSVFMELELGSGHIGQFFTPYEITKLMAMMVHGNEINSLSEQSFITLSEPASGAGGMVIAFAEIMLEKGLNPQKHLWVSCIDLDPVAAMMCYLQLSLMHIPAEVITGNTLTMEFSKIMRTPAHYLGFWDSKLNQRWSKNESSETKLNEETLKVLPQSNVSMPTGQLSLFDVVI